MGILREKTGEKTSKCMDVPEGCDLRLEAVDGRHYTAYAKAMESEEDEDSWLHAI